jgi:hypothetical protein
MPDCDTVQERVPMWGVEFSEKIRAANDDPEAVVEYALAVAGTPPTFSPTARAEAGTRVAVKRMASDEIRMRDQHRRLAGSAGDSGG